MSGLRDKAYANGTFQPWFFANRMMDAIGRGQELTDLWPPVEHPDNYQGIPAEAVRPLTEIAVAVVAEMVQCYIDAGSEREVTLENERLYDGISAEFRSWVVQP